MSRYVNDMTTSKSPEEVEKTAVDYLTKEGFRQVVHEGEMVWKKGTGLALGPQFMKVEPRDGMVHIEAWVKMAIIPGVYLGEMDLQGVIGAAPKKKLRTRVLEFERSLS